MNKLCYLRASTGMERREQKASREEASVGVERQSICLPCPIGVSHVRDRGCLSDRRERGGALLTRNYKFDDGYGPLHLFSSLKYIMYI